MTYRCTPQHLVRGESGFATYHRYHTTTRLEHVLNATYFVSMWHQLRPGDTIRVYQMENGQVDGPADGNRVLRYADTTVVVSNNRGVYLNADGPIREMPLDFEEAEAAAQPAPTPKRSIRWTGPDTAWSVFDADGKVVADGIDDKHLAEQIRDGKVAMSRKPMSAMPVQPPAPPAPPTPPTPSASEPSSAVF